MFKGPGKPDQKGRLFWPINEKTPQKNIPGGGRKIWAVPKCKPEKAGVEKGEVGSTHEKLKGKGPRRIQLLRQISIKKNKERRKKGAHHRAAVGSNQKKAVRAETNTQLRSEKRAGAVRKGVGSYRQDQVSNP